MSDRGRTPKCFCTVLTLIVLSIVSIPLNAQYMRQLNAYQMLRASAVYHVVGDSKGFLWFCTDRGLAKYDGHTAEFYTRQRGLGGDMVFNIYEDRQGRIWPFCYNGRYCFIENDSIHNEQNDPWLASLPHGSGYIKLMAQDTDGNLQFGFSTNTILRLRKAAAPLQETHQAGLNSLCADAHTVKFVPDLVALSILASDNRHRLEANLSGLRIFSGDSLVWKLDDLSLTQRTVNDIFLTADRQLLVATIRGLEVISLSSGKRLRLLDNIRISSCHPDVAGNYWITSLNNGIYFLHQEAARIRLLNGFDGLDFSVVNDGRVVFIKDQALFDVLPRGDSLAAIRIAGRIPNYYNPLYRSRDWSIFQDTWEKVPRLVNSAPAIAAHQKIVIALPDEDFLFFKNVHARGDTDFFMYGAGHQYQYKRIQRSLRFIDTLNFTPRVDASCQEPLDGTVYFAADNTLYRYNFERRAAEVILRAPALKDVVSMQFADSILFIQTEDRGLYTLRTREKGAPLRSLRPGFPVRQVIPFAHGRLYLSSDGVDYLGRLKGDSLHMTPLRYPFAATDYERLAFVGNKCLIKIDGRYYYFDTALLNRRQVERRVYLKTLSINGRAYQSHTVEIRNSSQVNIQVSLGVLDFSDDEHAIRYRLIGLDDTGWQQTQATELAFLLRKAGTYELQFAPAGASDAGPLRLRVVVHTPFFRSTLFIGLCVLAALALCAAIVIFVLRYRRRHFDRELDYLRLEHRAINALLNPHFIFNSINNIQGLINRSEKHDAAEYLAVLSRLIRQNLENLEFNLIPLEKELALIERYIMLQNLRFSGALELQINLEDESVQSVQIPPLLLHTFVENAIVHGFRPGDKTFHIRIDVRMMDSENLEIVVRDNGLGIADGYEAGTPGRRSMGISFNRKRLARLSEFYKLRQSITLRNLSTDGERGTEVRVVLYAALKDLLERRQPTAH